MTPNQRTKMKNITIGLSHEIVELFDLLVSVGKISSRSDGIRVALREFIKPKTNELITFEAFIEYCKNKTEILNGEPTHA